MYNKIDYALMMLSVFGFVYSVGVIIVNIIKDRRD